MSKTVMATLRLETIGVQAVTKTVSAEFSPRLGYTPLGPTEEQQLQFFVEALFAALTDKPKLNL